MATLVNVGKYNMSLKQMASLKEIGIDNEPYLDSLEPEEFFRIRGFGPKYVNYVRELRATYVEPEKDLLQGSVWDDVAGEEEYVREPTSYYALDDGRFDVRLTLNLPPRVARWLESVEERLPQMFPRNPEKHNLGFVIQPIIMDLMKNDVYRHGDLNDGSMGTMSKDDFAAFRPPEK